MGGEPAAVAAILGRQQNLITREQVIGAGMTRHALGYRLRDGGPWQVVLPGVYLAATGTPSIAQRDVAALLYAGPGSMLTGPAALKYHRFRVGLPEQVDVLVPSTRQRRDAGFVRLLRTFRMPSSARAFGTIRYAPAARAVGDAVRDTRSLREVRAMVAEAVQRGHCQIRELIDELNSGPSRHSALFREALSEVAGGSRSAAEAELRRLIIKSGLPVPLFNAEIWAGEEFVARPDAWYPRLGIAIEVDSTEWHLSPEDHKRDVERQTRMGKHLIVVLRFKPTQIRTAPAEVIAAVRDAIARAEGRPPLTVRTVPAEGA